jgi:hypothetical protein
LCDIVVLILCYVILRYSIYIIYIIYSMM